MTRFVLAILVALYALPVSAESAFKHAKRITVGKVETNPTLARNCAKRATVESRLSGKYGETLAGQGLQGQTGVVGIWRNESTGTWTAVVRRPNGISCVLAAGTNWQDLIGELN